MRIKPLGNRVLVQPEQRQARTPGGLELPDVAKGRPRHGKVLAVGPGSRNPHATGSDAGELIPVGVKEGQLVMYQEYAGYNAGDPMINYTRDTDPVLMDESDLLAIIED